jgi:signal transduction histidine kinase
VQRCGHDVEAQPKALQRVLANLVDNALKYGQGARISAAKEGNAIHVRIRDFGPGIPPAKLEAVFEPFLRLENARSSGTAGVGLGLTIAGTLARQNGAELTLRNHPAGGLEATLVLTRGIVPSHQSPAEPAEIEGGTRGMLVTEPAARID